jgi:GntR family transcriptional regulator
MANPMYRQIAEDLRGRIESGELAPGRQLPTELELRESYSASRNTVRDAIKWLTSLGLVTTRPVGRSQNRLRRRRRCSLPVRSE